MDKFLFISQVVLKVTLNLKSQIMAIEAINGKVKSNHYFKKLKNIKDLFLLFSLVNGKIQSLFIVFIMDKQLTGGVTFLWLLECKHSQAMADV